MPTKMDSKRDMMRRFREEEYRTTALLPSLKTGSSSGFESCDFQSSLWCRSLTRLAHPFQSGRNASPLWWFTTARTLYRHGSGFKKNEKHQLRDAQADATMTKCLTRGGQQHDARALVGGCESEPLTSIIPICHESGSQCLPPLPPKP